MLMDKCKEVYKKVVKRKKLSSVAGFVQKEQKRETNKWETDMVRDEREGEGERERERERE